ncbi:MAG TPA: vitamin K epoxide reductase family protein [Candidatus Paceibacterota bacterium]
MIFQNDILMHVAVFILGLAGFMVARHIYNHKKAGILLVCPIRFDCNTVVNSDYSKIFGIPVEILGMIYYIVISLSHLPFIFMSDSVPLAFVNVPLIASAAAFIFSVYLIGVQIFALKKGCSWCFVSAFISTVIFIVTLVG